MGRKHKKTQEKRRREKLQAALRVALEQRKASDSKVRRKKKEE